MRLRSKSAPGLKPLADSVQRDYAKIEDFADSLVRVAAVLLKESPSLRDMSIQESGISDKECAWAIMALGTVKNTYVNKNDAPIVALLAIRLAKLQQQSDGMAS
jgi:hypothetical protein